jgi:hemoglobin-like flavoprotein
MAFQYGIVGEVLLWTLTLTLGSEFDEPTKLAWVKIYSVMLKVIIPVAVREEKALMTAASTTTTTEA